MSAVGTGCATPSGPVNGATSAALTINDRLANGAAGQWYSDASQSATARAEIGGELS